MKRVLGIVAVMMFLFTGLAFAEPRQGASPITTYVDRTTTYKNFTFPYNSRDLIIQNQDSAASVYVDLRSDANTADTGSCYLLKAGGEIALYDYITSGISILSDKGAYATDGEASPICILVVY